MRLTLLLLLAADWGPGSVIACAGDYCVTCTAGKWRRCTMTLYEPTPGDWISPPTLAEWLKRGFTRSSSVPVSQPCYPASTGPHCEPETCDHLGQSAWWCL